MKMRKAMLAFLAAICILASVCTFGVFAESTTQVYAETSTSVQQGEYEYCYVYLDNLTDLASLNVAVHYDTEKVTVTDSYNQVACSLYDSSNPNGCLQYSYIFDGEGSNAQTNLFYFCYQINENAELGSTYFDIVVTDAYNTAIESVDINGSRCNFTIAEKTVAKTAYVYGPSDMETSVKEDFEISYSLGDWQIASGSMVVSYNPELFEFVEITNGEFLDGKLVDVNTSLDGSVYLSFLATEYNHYRTDLLKIKFRTLKNVTESSVIKLTVSELYDLDRNRIVCDGYTTNVDIAHDATYAEDSPSMSLSASYDAQTEKVTVTVLLEQDSHLGAGDFVLNFDTNYLTYSSVTKGFAPSFFNINDKNVDEGILKFSIISLSDITDGQTVLTVVFDTKRPCQDTLVDFEISGSGLADSLTNPILLNFVDANVTVPLEHTDGNDNNHLCDKGCGQLADEGCYGGTATCATQAICAECGNSYGALADHAYGKLIEATEAVHTQTELKGAVAAHYFCDICDKYFTETKDETTLEALTGEAPLHTPNTDDGDCTTAIICSVCGKITTPANVSHTGDTATCEKKAECTVCGKEFGEPKGHSYSSKWSKDDTHHWHECGCGDKADEAEHSYGEWTITKEATTTEKGSKTKSCVCGHSLTEEIPATGSSSGNEDEENSNEGNLITEPDVDNGGLSGGAITGIAIGTVAVASIGGFSLFWFAIKKKSWADLLKVFKK